MFELELHRNLVIHQPGDAVVVLRSHRDRWDGQRRSSRSLRAGGAAANTVAAVASRCRAEITTAAPSSCQKLIQLVLEFAERLAAQRAAGCGTRSQSWLGGPLSGWPRCCCKSSPTAGERDSAARSASEYVLNNGALWSASSRAGSRSTILPLSLPLNLIHVGFGSDHSRARAARQTGPFVPGDHGRLKPISGAYCGSLAPR